MRAHGMHGLPHEAAPGEYAARPARRPRHVRGRDRAGYEAQLDWTTALVEDLKTEGVIGQDVPTRWAVAQIDQLVWVAWTAVSEWGLSPERTATLAQRTLLNGLGAL